MKIILRKGRLIMLPCGVAGQRQVLQTFSADQSLEGVWLNPFDLRKPWPPINVGNIRWAINLQAEEPTMNLALFFQAEIQNIHGRRWFGVTLLNMPRKSVIQAIDLSFLKLDAQEQYEVGLPRFRDSSEGTLYRDIRRQAESSLICAMSQHRIPFWMSILKRGRPWSLKGTCSPFVWQLKLNLS
jgi:hypothetical protein